MKKINITTINIDKRYLYPLITLIVGIGIGLYISFSGSADDDSDEVINTLKGRIEVLKENNQKSYQKLEKYQEMYDSLSSVVLKSGERIDSLKTVLKLKDEEYEKDINAVDSFKHSELEEFFTDRYNKN